MKAIIIEDESIIANVLKNKIHTVDDDIEILEILDSKQSAVEYFQHHAQPDVIFMDIQLSDGVSFEIFDHAKITAPVIFTTAYDEYALRAFKANGVDYLLKPIQNEDLANAIQKVRATKSRGNEVSASLQDAIRSLLGNEHQMQSSKRYS